MGNRDIASARDYHERTKHSPVSIRSGPHYLDWDNQPHPFKVYEDLDPLPLEEHLASSGVPALQAIARSAPEGERGITRKELGELLFLCAGVTRRRRYFGGEMLFRAAACTGALYHIDVYVVAGPLADLEAGVYQFAPERFALTPLRTGDHRGALVEASGGEPAVAHAPAVLVFASTFWRNSWKYRDRAYRHCFWDGGTILANGLAAAAARDIPARTVMGFAEVPVNRLLGLSPDKEGALCLVPVGRAASPTAPSGEALPALDLVTRPLSRREVDYPSIREMHAASSLESGAEVRSWREGDVEAVDATGADESVTAIREIPLQTTPAESLPTGSIEQVIVRRGSTRRFSHEAITLAQLSNALHYATRGVATDIDTDGSRPLNQLYLIVNNVDGAAPGTYVLDRGRGSIQLLKEGEFRREAGFLGLGQEIPHDASVNVYLLTDLDPVLRRYGNRGYRLAQMEAAITAGRLYLAAYAQGFGASGLTFFDDDVTGFFSPHAAGKSVMFLIALGRRLKAE